MKLYTEEQLLNTIKSFQYYLEHYDKGVFPSVMEKHLKALAPIELPSDEEVERRIKDLEKRLYDCSKSNADLIGKINELPSDEEIEEYFKFGYGGDCGSAIYGAKWLLDKIKNK